ncbi:MAG: hypothetical protein NZ937_02135, partial [Armatimonadetes bacterium]|nr:hypothetical protein [Armatimonadota bacterium]
MPTSSILTNRREHSWWVWFRRTGGITMMRPIGQNRGECFVRRWSDALLSRNFEKRRDTDGL